MMIGTQLLYKLKSIVFFFLNPFASFFAHAAIILDFPYICFPLNKKTGKWRKKEITLLPRERMQWKHVVIRTKICKTLGHEWW